MPHIFIPVDRQYAGPSMGKVVYQYSSSLVIGTLLKRYKRFLSDIEINGTNITVYCPNTGPLLTVIDPSVSNQPCMISETKNKNRKYENTLEMVYVNGMWVGIHSSLANKIVYNALQAGLILECSGFSQIFSEVSFKDCKIDFKLRYEHIVDSSSAKKRKRSSSSDLAEDMLIEVKSVSMKRVEASIAEFPDCVSLRATKHANFLTNYVKSGGRAAIIFLIQRSDVNSFTISSLDPDYQQAVHEAYTHGVLILPYTCEFLPESSTISLGNKVPFLNRVS